MSLKLLALLKEVADAHFAAGDWTSDDDESFDAVYAKAQKADRALIEYVAGLEHAARHGVKQIKAFDRQCKAAEYTDTEQVWAVFHDIRARLTKALK